VEGTVLDKFSLTPQNLPEEIHVMFKQGSLSPGWDTKPWASEYEAEPRCFL